MTFSYYYTPYIWPMLTGMGLTAAVGVYSWRHRNVPGATGLAFIMFLSAVKVLSSALELAALDYFTKVFWYKIGDLSLFPITAAGLVFALEYAGLDTWLNRRTFALLAVPFLIYVPLSFTNDVHNLLWTDHWLDGRIRHTPGPLAYGLPAYGLLISAVTISVFIWLFVHSRLHRWPIGLILFNMLTSRSLYVLNEAGTNPVNPLEPVDVAAIYIPLIYFVALFQFRLLDVVPVARNRAIEQMRDGMLVLDAENRIADANRAAQELLGVAGTKVTGRQVRQVLRSYPDLLDRVVNTDAAQDEVWLDDTRCYQVRISPLVGRRGFGMGRLVLLSDISEQKQAERRFQEHQRMLAGLEEREWLARELHDGIGQVLAAAHLQVDTARELLAQGQAAGAETCLKQLAGVIQEGKGDVRDYLLGVKVWSSSISFFTGLRRYLTGYGQTTGIRTELNVPLQIEDLRMDEAVETQLQRIIQEALTNIRKHAGARTARVAFDLFDSRIQVTIGDDGRGFDTAVCDDNQGFGLCAMRGRAEGLGGRFDLASSPGKGTQVIVTVPWNKEET